MAAALPAAAPAHADAAAPAAWLLRHQALLPARGRALDVACGSGRHLAWLAQQGLQATGVDCDAAALAGARQRLQGRPATLVQADLESGPWPFEGQVFDVVVVTQYLWRPLLPRLQAALAEGGTLLYETFADGQQTVGRPSRADFLLQPGELLRAFAALRVVAFEDGFEPGTPGGAPPRFVQRLAAVRPRPAAAGTAERYPLHR